MDPDLGFGSVFRFRIRIQVSDRDSGFGSVLGFRLHGMHRCTASMKRVNLFEFVAVCCTVPANVRQAKDSRQNEGVNVAAETKAFILKEQSTKISFETVLFQ